MRSDNNNLLKILEQLERMVDGNKLNEKKLRIGALKNIVARVKSEIGDDTSFSHFRDAVIDRITNLYPNMRPPSDETIRFFYESKKLKRMNGI